MLLLFSTLYCTSWPLEVQIAKGKERFSKYCIVAFVGKFSAIVYCIRVCTNVGDPFYFLGGHRSNTGIPIFDDFGFVSQFGGFDSNSGYPFLAALVSFPVFPIWRFCFYSIQYIWIFPVILILMTLVPFSGILNLAVWSYSISGYPDFDDFGSILGYSQFGVQKNKF